MEVAKSPTYIMQDVASPRKLTVYIDKTKMEKGKQRNKEGSKSGGGEWEEGKEPNLPYFQFSALCTVTYMVPFKCPLFIRKNLPGSTVLALSAITKSLFQPTHQSITYSHCTNQATCSSGQGQGTNLAHFHLLHHVQQWFNTNSNEPRFEGSS